MEVKTKRGNIRRGRGHAESKSILRIILLTRQTVRSDGVVAILAPFALGNCVFQV